MRLSWGLGSFVETLADAAWGFAVADLGPPAQEARRMLARIAGARAAAMAAA